MERFDAIVIGAGLGGMLAAGMLARSGRRVLVLEREARVGGRLRSYEIDGFVVDAGAYLWPNAHLDAALAAAGVSGFQGSTIPPTQMMRVFVQGHAGKRFSFPWPGRGDSEKMREIAQAAFGLDAAGLAELAQVWERFAALSDDEVAALEHVPFGAALGRFVSDERIARALRRNVMLFGTYDPDAASMADCIRLRRRRASTPDARAECAGPNAIGGVRALPVAVLNALRTAGVDVRLGCEVDHILIESGRVAGVMAHGPAPFRERYDAPVVVCNVPVWQVLALVAADQFPDDLVAAAGSWNAVGGVVASAFAFDGLPHLRETGVEDRFLGWTRLLTGPGAAFGGGMLWSSHHSPRNAPPGKHVLQAMRLSPRADLADERRVRAILDDFRTLLTEVYVDAADKLLWTKSWISRDGSEYMVASAARPPVEAPGVAGLYFVGETTDVPAVQMDAAALSALRCADLVRANTR